MSRSVDITVEITPMCCGECGVWFGMDEVIRQRRLEDGKTWYCPNGHPRAFMDSELSKERKRAGRLAAQLDQERAAREAEERSHSATKGKLTKTRNRLSGGVCPCCNRTFVKLGQHMKTKHPEFGGTP